MPADGDPVGHDGKGRTFDGDETTEALMTSGLGGMKWSHSAVRYSLHPEKMAHNCLVIGV